MVFIRVLAPHNHLLDRFHLPCFQLAGVGESKEDPYVAERVFTEDGHEFKFTTGDDWEDSFKMNLMDSVKIIW